MPIPRDKKTIHDRRGGACPVCGEQNSKCATVDDERGFTLCFEFPSDDPIKAGEGWKFLGDSEGIWGKWRQVDPDAEKPQERDYKPLTPIKQIDYSATLTPSKGGRFIAACWGNSNSPQKTGMIYASVASLMPRLMSGATGR